MGADERAPASAGSTTRDAAPSAVPGENGAEPLVIRMPVDVRSLALTVIAVVAVIYLLQYAQALLIPIVLGILLSYALDPIVAALHRVYVPRAIGAGVAVVLLVGTIGLGIYTLSDEAMSIVNTIPEAAQRIRDRIRTHQRSSTEGPLAKVQQAATEIDRAAQAATSTPGAPPVPPAKGVQKVEVVQPSFRASDYLWWGGFGVMNFAAQIVLVLFLVYFFLVTGDLYKRKVVKIAGPTFTQKKITVQILDDINLQIASFMRVQVFTSLLVAVATGAALWSLGLEHFLLWGLLAGVFNSIPYLGPVIVTAGLGIVAFMQFDDVWRTAMVCGVAFAITSLEGFLLTPMLMSRAAQMNPVAIFVGLMFWSWVWGVWGTVLAVPMLMMLKAICDHVEDLQPFGELLGE
jgi:predicted PurR-regulated permease PerM